MLVGWITKAERVGALMLRLVEAELDPSFAFRVAVVFAATAIVETENVAVV